MADAAARRIQRMYRRNQVLFSDKMGPKIFVRRGRLKALYGQIHFSDGDRTARFLTLADTTSPALLARYVHRLFFLGEL